MNDMSQTTVNLGYVPKNRGEYSSTASYYKDNIVQYNGSSYICNPPNYDPDTAPTASITGVAPYDSDPAVPNTGWAVFCNDSSGVGEGVYDVSVDHTTDSKPKVYASLSAALNDIPAAKKKGGMEIRFIFNNSNYAVDKEEGITTQPAGTAITSSPTMVDGTYKASQLLTYFSTLPTATGAGNAVVYYKEVDGTYTTWTITLQSSDNKYVQYRLMADEWSTTVADWQGIDDAPTKDSLNLIDSGGVYNVLKNSKNITSLISLVPGYIERNGTITAYATWFYGTYILNVGETITVNCTAADYPTLGIATNGTDIGDVVTVIQGNTYTATAQTLIVISAGSRLNSAILTSAKNIFDNADSSPEFDSPNVVNGNGIANSINKVRIDGRLTQERQLYLDKQFNPNVISTKLGGHSGDKIIVTLIDNNGVIASGESVTLQHGPAEAGIPYTVLYPNTPAEATLVNDVNSFTIYCSNAWMAKSGTVSLKIEFKEVYAKETDFLALSDNVNTLNAKEHLPYDKVLALDSSARKSYDTGIVLNAGDVVSITLHDPDNIITSEDIPLHYNDVTGPYKLISPNNPVIFEASEETRLLTWVSSSWLSQSGNISFHVEYKSFDNSVIDIILPSKAYAYVGGEFNIYNENVVFLTNKDNHYVYWEINDISAYKVYEDRLELLPTVEMIGTHTITCFVKEKYMSNSVVKKTMTLEIVANQSVSNKKVLFIGDSLTNAGYYAHFIEYLSNNGIQSIGTRESTVWSSFDPTRQVSVHHEGRGGWSAQDYTRTYPGYRTNYDNPFWDGSKFNFSYYMQEQGYTRPDAVFLNLGTNEIAALDKQIDALEIMIESIHQYDSTIPVFVHLITPPATQDGWAYTGHGDSILFDMNARNERKRYIEEFDNQIQNVYVTSPYFNIDRYYDFVTVEEQVSQRNPQMVLRQKDTVHLSRYGYYKMGDVYYANIMKILST